MFERSTEKPYEPYQSELEKSRKIPDSIEPYESSLLHEKKQEILRAIRGRLVRSIFGKMIESLQPTDQNYEKFRTLLDRDDWDINLVEPLVDNFIDTAAREFSDNLLENAVGFNMHTGDGFFISELETTEDADRRKGYEKLKEILRKLTITYSKDKERAIPSVSELKLKVLKELKQADPEEFAALMADTFRKAAEEVERRVFFEDDEKNIQPPEIENYAIYNKEAWHEANGPDNNLYYYRNVNPKSVYLHIFRSAADVLHADEEKFYENKFQTNS